MVVEEAGLEVDDDACVVAPELVDDGTRLGKLAAIPGEYIAALADARVTRPEMERRQRDVMSSDLVDELRQPRLRVGRIGEAHCWICVTQAPARAERHASRQLRERANDVANARAGEQIVVEVA